MAAVSFAGGVGAHRLASPLGAAGLPASAAVMEGRRVLPPLTMRGGPIVGWLYEQEAAAAPSILHVHRPGSGGGRLVAFWDTMPCPLFEQRL